MKPNRKNTSSTQIYITFDRKGFFHFKNPYKKRLSKNLKEKLPSKFFHYIGTLGFLVTKV